MDYKKFNFETWKILSDSGDLVSGYQTLWLSFKDGEESDLHLFKDKSGHYHFSIEAPFISATDIEDPHVNGLHITLKSYRFNTGKVSQFIDVECTISGYLQEFTEIVKEIVKAIFEKGELPINAVNQIISSWLSFWTKQRKEILTEEEQIGLICELNILQKLCIFSPKKALKSWTGPLGEKHDFNCTDWNFEVKGTRKSDRTHIINGIDQLNVGNKKRLAFISFLLTTSDNLNSVNLPILIESIKKSYFNEPELTIKFNELLSGVGYNPIHYDEYQNFNVEIIESTFYEVNENFPKLTSNMLSEPINARITSIRYKISLEGLTGIDVNNLSWGDYFY